MLESSHFLRRPSIICFDLSTFICGGGTTCCTCDCASISFSTLGDGAILFSTLGGGGGTSGEIGDTSESEGVGCDSDRGLSSVLLRSFAIV